MSGTYRRDIVVVGASFGGVEALTRLSESLPADFPATMLVVQHTADHSPGVLARILNRSSIAATMASDGMPLEHGIFVAPPGRHMLLGPDSIRVVFGPRENRARPAIDPLFRTAAVHHRSRVVGVVLTGLLGDGAVGLHAIDRCGGLCIVQAPDDATAPDMPRRALQIVPHARLVTLAELPGLLTSIVNERAPEPPPVPELLRTEVALTERVMSGQASELPGRSTDFTCPDCSGTIHAFDEGGVTRYRCRVGHAYSADALLTVKDESVERSLWVAQQTLQERAQMLLALAHTERDSGRMQTAGMYDDRARETEGHAQRLRELIQQLET